MVHVYIGDGKGKTTASLGLALRALGWGKRVYIAQFLKDPNSPCGEIKALKKIKIRIDRFKNQIHPIFLKKGEFDHAETKKSVEQSLKKIAEILRGRKYDVIILDEILNVLALRLCSQKDLKRIINKAKATELILTGRSAPGVLLKLADYVSCIKKVKHPFDKKVSARKGIEY
ncbi:MAG: cob(I)yrinic acid a,c-diamide adenosyltransferase [Candidatus Omnitrophota bacterium]|nr:MAG: cob(I)yrinic acid a,c-diamide adenosyltransferase [Candidatus Omnitrophota bacterium]